jgi:N-acyl-D-aspartate/D-glutamate deacylase
MDDYYSLIARAVARLPSKDDQARHAIYERARTALQESLRALDPPISEAELANMQSALEEAIQRVEQGVAIETAVDRMERDLLATEMRQIVREEDVSHAGFISKAKQFIRGRFRSRE